MMMSGGLAHSVGGCLDARGVDMGLRYLFCLELLMTMDSIVGAQWLFNWLLCMCAEIEL